MGILVLVDSGSLFSRKKTAPMSNNAGEKETKEDVAAEAASVSSSDDLLRVLHVTKTFPPKTVVDDVSIGVSRDTVFALLGPNAAGKTTLFSIIRALSSQEYAFLC